MNGLNEYDFSARWMDNAVPGFTTPDPLAELHYSESPYSYCGANPVNRVDPMGLAYFAGDGGAIWREGDNNDTWTDPRTHQKYSNIGDYYTFRTSGGTQTDYKGKFDSFVDDPAPDSKNYSFFNYGSMNGAKDNTGIANNSTTGWGNSGSQLPENVNHTVSEQTKVLDTKYLGVTYNVDVSKVNNPKNLCTVTTDSKLNPLSETVGSLTVGNDGSVTYGSTMYVGWNVVSNEFILGASVPTGLNSSVGATMTLRGGAATGVAIGVGIGAAVIATAAILYVAPGALVLGL